MPRSKRDRLTKKQLEKINKPDLMTEALGAAVIKSEKKGKGVLLVEDKSSKNSDFKLQDFTQPKKLYKEDESIKN